MLRLVLLRLLLCCYHPDLALILPVYYPESQAVFLDADTLVVRNIDDLFEREELSAAPYVVAVQWVAAVSA